MQASPVTAAAPPGATSYAVPATAEEAVMVALTRLGRRLRQRMPGEDLDLTAIVLLKALVDGPHRLTALAAALELDASTVSRQVRQLEDRGLLARTDDPEDGRASRIALSEEGRSRLEAGAQRRRRVVADLIADWDESDRESLRTLLTRLSSALDQTTLTQTGAHPAHADQTDEEKP